MKTQDDINEKYPEVNSLEAKLNPTVSILARL